MWMDEDKQINKQIHVSAGRVVVQKAWTFESWAWSENRYVFGYVLRFVKRERGINK